MTDQNPLELISEITELNDLSDFMKDDDLDKAMSIVIKLIMKPDVPASTAARLIVQLQAMSAKFSMLAVNYATINKDRAGTPNNHRKNIYYSTKEALDRLCDALKYSARHGG